MAGSRGVASYLLVDFVLTESQDRNEIGASADGQFHKALAAAENEA